MSSPSRGISVWTVLMLLLLAGCAVGEGGTVESSVGEDRVEELPGNTGKGAAEEGITETSPLFEDAHEAVDPWLETGSDGVIDFEAQRAIRPGIVGWIYVPGTEIDVPVFSGETEGAAWLDRDADPYLMDCLSIVHGASPERGGVFATLYDFADPDFFGEHHTIVYYNPYGALRYAVVAAGACDSAVWESYDMESEEGRKRFVTDVGSPKMGKNLWSKGAKGLSADNLYLTLMTGRTTGASEAYSVTGILTGVQ